MLSLRIFSKTENKILETFKNDPISLNYNYKDISKLSNKGSFSQEFRLPATPNNEEYFKGVFQANYVGDINPKRKIGAVIMDDTVPVMYGHIQVKDFVYHKQNPEYRIVFFGEAIDLWRDLGDLLLSDLDLSAFDHALTNANVTTSNSGGLFSGEVKVGIIDRGKYWSATGEQGSTDMSDWKSGDFVSFMKVRTILEAIFDEAEYEYDSTFLTSTDFSKMFMPLLNSGLYGITSETPTSEIFNVGNPLVSNITFPGTESPFSFLSDTGNFYDLGGNFTSGGADSYFIPPYIGTYSMQYYYNVSTDLAAFGGTNNDLFIRFGIKDDLGNWIHSNFWNANGYSGTTYNMISEVVDLDLSPDRTYRLYRQVLNVAVTETVTFENSTSTAMTAGCGWRMVSASFPASAGTLDISKNLPKMKQKEFIASLMDMFNLVLIPDKVNPKKFTIEPYDDYKASGDDLDWTDKLDTSKDYIIKPTTDIQSKKYSFEYSEGGDFINKAIQDGEKRTFGRYLIDDTENDFSTGENKIKPTFVPYPISPIAGTNIVIHKAFTDKLEPLKEAKPHIVYDCGMVDCSPIPSFDYSTGTTTTFTEYRHFSHFDEYEPQVSDSDLNFGMDVTFYPVANNPVNTLFNTYWRQFITQLYSSESRMFEGFFNLDPVDIATLSYADRIWIKDSWWTPISVEGYTGEETTKVVLLKVLNTQVICDYTPVSTDNNLQVIFEDASGSTSDGDQTCCELYGYTWSPSQEICLNPVLPGEPILINSGESLTTRGSRTTAQGANMYQGNSLSIGAGSRFNSINGINLTAGDNLIGSSLIGEDNYVDISTLMFGLVVSGRNVNAFMNGRHFGAKNTGDLLGQAQSGEFIMHANDTSWASSSSIELLLEDGLRVELPDETMWSVFAQIVVEDWTSGTHAFTGQCSIIAHTTWWKDRGNAAANSWTIISQAGSYSSFTLSTDVATDTDEHRLNITNGGSTISTPVKITARLTYVQTVE